MKAEPDFGIDWRRAAPGDVAGIDTNSRDKYGWTPLFCAAQQCEDPAVVSALLDAGADVSARNKVGEIALHEAAWNNDNESVTAVLLQAGSPVNRQDKRGLSPLHSAIGNINPAVAKALLQAGADVAARDNYGMTPLHYAARNNFELVEALLQAGADINARGKDDMTPLHLAARSAAASAFLGLAAKSSLGNAMLFEKRHKYRAAVPFAIPDLLKHGADAKLKDKKGRTALDYADKNKDIKGTEVYQALREA